MASLNALQQAQQIFEQLKQRAGNAVGSAVQNFNKPITAPVMGRPLSAYSTPINFQQPVQPQLQQMVMPRVQAAIQNFQQPIQAPRIQPVFNTPLAQVKPIQWNQPRPLAPAITAVGQTMQQLPTYGQALGLPKQQFTPGFGAGVYNLGADTIRGLGQTVEKIGSGKPLDIADAVAIGGVAPMGRITSKVTQIAPAIKILRNKLTPEDVQTIGKFAEIVETKGGKANTGVYGQQVASLARNVFGKEAENWSNQKLKNVFDLVLGKIGTQQNKAGLGLGIQNIRESAQAGLSDAGSLYHQAGVEDARSFVRGQRYAQGMNLSSTPELALSQGEKGAILEIDKNAVGVAPLKHKPGLDFTGAQQGLKSSEFEIIHAPPELNSAIKSVIFDKPLNSKGADKFFGIKLEGGKGIRNVDNWKMETLPNGKVRYINPDYKSHVAQSTIGEATKGTVNPQELLTGETKPQLPTQEFGAGGGSNGSSRQSITQIPNSENPYFNTNKLNVAPQAKQKLNEVIQEVRPQIEKVVGKKLSNQEVINTANNSSKVLHSVVDRSQTQDFAAKLLRTRQQLAAAAQSGTVDKSYIDNLMAIKSHATDIARKLQSFSIGADPKLVTSKDAILDAVLQVEKDTTKVTEAAKGVDFNDLKQATDFYRKFIKPTKSEWIDLVRYNSMLSSPNTHINNAFSNLANTALVAPIEKTVSGTLDFLGSKIAGKPQKQFASEGAMYAKGYMSSVHEAAHAFADVMRGKMVTGNLDVRQIPLSTSSRVSNLNIPTRLLEASDQFFTSLTKGGETAALVFRKSKGVNVGNIETQAMDNAKYRLFRSELKDPRQGTLLNGIDEVTGTIQKLRSSKNPIVSTIAKFTLPFVRTPMNILKQGVEYSPAGIATLPGAANKTEQLSKTIIGSSAAAATALLVASGRTTWAEPTDPKKKAAYRDAGIQPYSVKIGNDWVAYDKLPPAIGFPIAFASALHDAQQNKLLNDSQVHMILSAVAKAGNYYTDQSYLKNVGDIVASAKGDVEGMTRFVGNYPQQLVPYRALLGWMARVTDPYQRKVNTNASYWEQQVQNLFTQIPVLSQTVPARTNAAGEPIANQNRFFNAFSPTKVKEENPQKADYYKMLQQKTMNTRNIDQIKTMIEQGKQPNMNIGEQAQAAETTQNPQDKLKQKLIDDVNKEKVKLMGKPIVQDGKIYYQIGDSVNVINTNEQLTPPKLTGQEQLDLKAKSDYTSLIDRKVKETHDLISIGKLTQQQGETLIEGLKQKLTDIKNQSKQQSLQLTGNPTIDKLVISKQMGAITSNINEVVDYVQKGKLTAQQGEELINKLKAKQQSLRLGTGSGKAKKPKALKLPKIKAMTSNKSPKMIKIPKLKTPKLKKIKIGRMKK